MVDLRTAIFEKTVFSRVSGGDRFLRMVGGVRGRMRGGHTRGNGGVG